MLPVVVGIPIAGQNAQPTMEHFFMTASGNYVSLIFRVPKTGTLDKFEFRMADLPNPPDNGLRLSFQDVDPATGLPDGTPDQFRDIASISADTWTVPGVLTDDGTNTGVKRSVTIGQIMACRIDFVSFVAGDFLTVGALAYLINATGTPSGAFPYSAVSGSKVNPNILSIALKYDDGTYAYISPLVYPVKTWNGITYNNGSAADEVGLRFTVPVDTDLLGIHIRGDIQNDAEIVIYDGTTPIKTVSCDGTITSGPGSYFIMFDAVPLTASTVYRAILKPTTASNVSVYYFDVESNAHLGAVEGGTDWYYTSRVDAGSWTDLTTARPWMGLVLDMANGGGGGGGEHAYSG